MTVWREWREKAMPWMRYLARRMKPFTSDDLLARVGHPDPHHRANSKNNMIGPVFKAAHEQGIIRPIEGYVTQSGQPHRKGGIVRVWIGTYE